MGKDAPEENGEAATSEPDLDHLQFILQDTRVVLLQQILAHDSGALSAEELAYRNPDLTDENIRYHLRELEHRGIVKGLEIPKGERKRELPNTFFAVTEKGIRLLKRANLYEEISVWNQVYQQMERTDRIDSIEAIGNRPEPEWYDAEGEIPEDTSETSSKGPIESGSPEVLVVDDERELADIYASAIDDLYTVKTAYDGDQAISLLDEEIDVVLLDRRMPGTSGDEVLEEIRERELNCRVALLTAVEPEFDVIDMGFDDYLIKPVSPEEVRRVVTSLVERAEINEQLQELFALVSKKAVIEANKEKGELADNDEYSDLVDQIQKLENQVENLLIEPIRLDELTQLRELMTTDRGE